MKKKKKQNSCCKGILSFCRMDLKRFMSFLLYVTTLTVSGVFGKNELSEAHGWTRQNLPRLLVTKTAVLDTSLFRGKEEDGVEGGSKVLCGIECQSALPSATQAEQERILGYETMYENGTRTLTDISLQWMNKTAGAPASSPVHIRRKRHVYGADGRFVISDSNFITNYPFSTAVRLSTGCSGVLVSPRHVLTAAHCVHDGRDYLENARGLKVGLLQLKSRRRTVGRKRRGRQKGDMKQDGKKDQREREEGGEKNNLGVRKRRGGERRRHRMRKRREGGAKDGSKERSRTRRSDGPGKQPVFRWTQVKQTQIPQGWIHTNTSADFMSGDYNYALLQLKRPVKQKFMELGVAPTAPLALIHFSGYDTDKSLSDGRADEKVIYRFCSVVKESGDLMYQHCDAQRGATGAGVYIRLRQDAGLTSRKGKWRRKVIGVFSGHQWVEVEGGEQRDFNVAVRITPSKYAQICHWIHGDQSLCEEV